MPHEVLAVIPARGGSKGIPRKNVRIVGGKPLIAHAIGAVLAARNVTRVVVSTDDDEIASVSQGFGAGIVRRPQALATDTASSEQALLHALDFLQREENYRPDIVLLVQCTSPLTTPMDIDGTVEALLAQDADCSLAVAPFHYFLWSRDAAGKSVAINHDHTRRLMRQQRRPEFVETGAVYAMRVAGFQETRHRFFGNIALHETPAENCLEIDDPVDLELAEQRLHMRSQVARSPGLSRPPAAIIFDFDGVHTDDRVFVDQDGRESVVCSRRDGMGIEALRQLGIPMIVVSKEANPVVAARCRKLALEHYHGVDEKIALVSNWIASRGLDPARCLYVGNDINDLACMRYVGLSAAPRDAHPAVLREAGIVLDAEGGRGAIRELADKIGSVSAPEATGYP